MIEGVGEVVSSGWRDDMNYGGCGDQLMGMNGVDPCQRGRREFLPKNDCRISLELS